MRILIIAYHFPPSLSVAALRLESFAQSLSSAGHDVTVLTLADNTSSADEKRSVNGNEYRVVRIQNPLLNMAERYFSAYKETQTKSTSPVQRPSLINKIVTRFNEWRKNKGIIFLGRMPDISDVWYFTAKSWLKKQQEWDWVISSYAPYSTLLLGRYMKKAGKCKRLLLDFRDPWSTHHLFSGLPFIRLLEKNLEKKCLEHANAVTAATPRLMKLLTDTYSTIKISGVVLNGYFPQKKDIPINVFFSGITITHLGSIYLHKHSTEPFFEALADFKNQKKSDLRLMFAGNEKQFLDSLAEKYKISDVWQHLGYVDFETTQKIVSSAQIGIVFDSNTNDFNGVLPVKVFDYMAQGLPILLIGDVEKSDLTTILEDYGNFWAAKPNKASILKALNRIQHLNYPKISPPNRYTRRFQNEKLLKIIRKPEDCKKDY